MKNKVLPLFWPKAEKGLNLPFFLPKWITNEAVKPSTFFISLWAHAMQMPPVDRSTAWRPQGADLYSTGASGAPPVRPINAPNPVESVDRLGQGAVVREPDKPSAPDATNRDWTEVKKKDTVEEPPEPPKEPIYKQLLELIQSMWRASGSAVEMAQEVNKVTQQERLAQQVKKEDLTYSDPKIKRTTGL